MITPEKFGINLKVLKSRLPTKPHSYTNVHPITISEGLKYYCNSGTINSVQACVSSLNDEFWPMPLWFNPKDIRVGFWNKWYYKKQFNSWDEDIKFKNIKDFDFLWIPLLNKLFYGRSYDVTLSEAFTVNVDSCPC